MIDLFYFVYSLGCIFSGLRLFLLFPHRRCFFAMHLICTTGCTHTRICILLLNSWWHSRCSWARSSFPAPIRRVHIGVNQHMLRPSLLITSTTERTRLDMSTVSFFWYVRRCQLWMSMAGRWTLSRVLSTEFWVLRLFLVLQLRLSGPKSVLPPSTSAYVNRDSLYMSVE